MPLSNSSRKRDMFEDTSNPTWAGLEASKSRLASAMDRCEYLASSRNRFTEVAASQTMTLNRVLHKKDPRMHFSRTLNQSVPELRKMLDSQREILGSSKTGFKRIDQLNKHVIHKEEKGQGDLGRDAARTSAKQAAPTPLKDVFSDPYAQLATYQLSPTGQDRDWPLMSVTTSMPYLPPAAALTHGWKNKDPGSTMTSTMTSARSLKR